MSKFIGWKMCKIYDRDLKLASEFTGLSAHALVKLEIDEGDIISNPKIREDNGFSVYDVFLDEPIDIMGTYYDIMGTCYDILRDVRMSMYGDQYEKFRETLVFNSAVKTWEDQYIHFVKCRCKKAKVLDIILISKDNEGKTCNLVESFWDHTFTYELGEEVEYKNPLCTIWSDPNSICGPGIHYFESWETALLYSCTISNVLVSELKYAFDKVGDINE